MKKFLYSVFMLAAVVLAACSNDDNGDIQPKRGMTLNASVEDLSSRATMTDESGTWKFAFAANDQVSVSNNKISNYYTFTNNGSQFTCAQAEVTKEDAYWYAYFPGNDVDLTNQTGNFADVANKFAVAGGTAEATTGEKGLSITLKPKVAVLRIVAVDKKCILDIHVKTTADGKWVKGLTAKKDAADFTVSTSEAKTTLLHKAAGEVKAGDINYVVVPAGVKIAIYNGDMLLNTTKKDEGLTVGKYYTITSGPTKGTTNALINGKETPINWVQLWAGGPRFATQNVAEEMTWTDAANTGKEYVWGENWRTPTAEEVTEEGGLQAEWNTKEEKWVVKEGSPTINVTTKDGIEETVEFTGVQPGYTKNTLTLYNRIDSHGYSHFNFWTTTENNGYGCMYRIMIDKGIIGIFGPSSFESKDTKCLVRPVLSIENITNNKK